MNAVDWKTKLCRCLAVVAGWGVAGGAVVAAPAPRLELSRRDSGWFLEYVPSPRAGEVTLHYASELADLWSTKVRVVEVPADSGPLVIEVTDLVRGPRGFFGVTESGDPVLPGGFVLIPGGTFQMGDTFAEGNDDERPVHPVNVSAFFLQARETTKAEWDEWISPSVPLRQPTLHLPGGEFCLQWLWALRHDRQCVGVVLGLVWRRVLQLRSE